MTGYVKTRGSLGIDEAPSAVNQLYSSARLCPKIDAPDHVVGQNGERHFRSRRRKASGQESARHHSLHRSERMLH